jgi:sulfur carrier protein
VKGIEPSYAAWEAAVLPLNYTRGAQILPSAEIQDKKRKRQQAGKGERRVQARKSGEERCCGARMGAQAPPHEGHRDADVNHRCSGEHDPARERPEIAAGNSGEHRGDGAEHGEPGMQDERPRMGEEQIRLRELCTRLGDRRTLDQAHVNRRPGVQGGAKERDIVRGVLDQKQHSIKAIIGRMIQVIVNGAAHRFERPLEISALLAQLELRGKKIAVEKNGEIIPRSAHAQTLIKDGDELEIVVAVGGG